MFQTIVNLYDVVREDVECENFNNDSFFSTNPFDYLNKFF